MDRLAAGGGKGVHRIEFGLFGVLVYPRLNQLADLKQQKALVPGSTIL